jgi:DNA-binding CsgD family transcriptional regulator/tetratricopeptide (TPR) repeat protein
VDASVLTPSGRATGLLERDRELSALGEWFAGVREARRGRLVLIGGEAGVGKTVLLRRFCDEYRPPARVLWGACDALFTPRPLGPLLDIAQSTAGQLEELVESGAKPYEVAGELMRELGAKPPTILVLEDVHWADEATLDVLRIVGRRVETLPALVVATYRDDELDPGHPLRIVLGELTAAEAVNRISVPPLSPTAVAQLAEPHGVDADELYRTTGGNPFFVTEALAAGEQEIPQTIRDAVLARAARLSDEARSVVEAVAVVPPQAEVWLLRILAGDAVAHLDECLNSGMLSPSSQAVAFRHELARLAVEASLPPHRMVELHKQALAALADPANGVRDLARLAHHAEAAGDVEAVLKFAPAAGARAASLGAHREAAAQYARTLRFAESLPLETRAELLVRRSHECYLTDENAEAIEAQQRALEYYREVGDPRKEGDSLRSLSQMLWCPGRIAECERAGREAVAVLERLPPGRELAMAYSNLASVCGTAENGEEADAWGRRALELAERLDDTEIAVHALATIGGLESAIECLERAERAGLHEEVGRAFVLLARKLVFGRSHALTDYYLEAGIEYCSEHGLELFRLYLLAYLARWELDQGRWGEAAETAAAVIRVPRASTMPRTIALSTLGLVRARRGDPDVWAPLDEAWALARPTGELPRIGPAAAARAEAAWLEGRAEAVAEATQAALELAVSRKSSWTLGALCYWRWQAGIREQIPSAAAEPYALQIAGDWARASDLWTEIGRPYEAALALADADQDEAFRRGLDELQRLGARPAASIVARRLRERGARGLPRGPRPSTQGNPAQLTARELEVLALVARGLHNAEIAERLFLSAKTIDHHVSSILGKLGARTRAQASAEAVRLGLAARDR